MNLSGALDPEDMAIHRQEYTAIDTDAPGANLTYVCLDR
jgi:hypothetical protein